ncbi:LacI family transcriptional regulator [Bordetella ansorpii]|uniref:LacI family transcriptional regulator n=1 Tax=Bordetella ansorpii TaxID=288768 RepID=A0A157P490_9BORD|nr:LacI family DNA-binding transcriptional regulator [Bordetella ansorpii]SAI28106.1 LacI family transcriptional regulator [Bordetella ansorpii]
MPSHPSERSSKPASGRAPRRGSGRVTIADVARVAGMSMHTVSRVLNAPEHVPARTVKLIHDAIAQTGYVQDLIAGGLASGRSRLVAVTVPTLGSPVFLEALQTLSLHLGRHGYQMMLTESGYDPEQEVEAVRAILGRRPDGVVMMRTVLTAVARTQLRAARIPVVEAWDWSDDPVDTLIGFSHEAAGGCVARFLAETGRRRPVAVIGDDPRAGRRLQGFTATARELGLIGAQAQTPHVLLRAPATMGAGRSGLAELLAREPAADAVVCSTDMIAMGVLLEAAALGRQVPGDLAVVGFGDQAYAAATTPALTTVRIDGSLIGEQAARAIIDRLDGRASEGMHVDVGFTLIRRQSA